MNVLLSILLVIPLVTIVFLLLAVVLIWVLGGLSFRELSTSTLGLDQPRLPEWFLRALRATWPIEWIFACVLAPSIAVLVLHVSNLAIIGGAVLVSAFAYLLAFALVKILGGKWGGGWGDGWGGADFGSGTGCEMFLIGLVVALVFGLVAFVYYGLVVAICRYLISPIVLRVAGINNVSLATGSGSTSARVSGPYDRFTAGFDQTVQLDPDDAKVYHNRGFAYYKQGDLNRAIADYDRAIGLQADNAKVYLLRGLAYQQQGQRDQAIADYHKALELSEDSQGRAIAKDALQALGVK
jgi:hypothetical protein